MKVRNGVLVLTVVCLAAASVAMAGQGEGKKNAPHRKNAERGQAMFKSMDADSSGEVSLEEFKAAHEKRMAARKEKMGDKWDEERASKMPAPEDMFKKMDADENGSLTLEEMQQAHRKRMAGHNKGERMRKQDGSGPECPTKKKAKKTKDAPAEAGA